MKVTQVSSESEKKTRFCFCHRHDYIDHAMPTQYAFYPVEKKSGSKKKNVASEPAPLSDVTRYIDGSDKKRWTNFDADFVMLLTTEIGDRACTGKRNWNPHRFDAACRNLLKGPVIMLKPLVKELLHDVFVYKSWYAPKTSDV